MKYTIYDNRTEFPVIIRGTADQCAKAMGISTKSFGATVTRCCNGTCKKWTVFKEPDVLEFGDT